MDLVIAVGGGGQHIALALARLMRLGALSDAKAFVIDADSESRLAFRLRTLGHTLSSGTAHPPAGAETGFPALAPAPMKQTQFPGQLPLLY